MVKKPNRKLRRPTVPKERRISFRKKVLAKKEVSYLPTNKTKKVIILVLFVLFIFLVLRMLITAFQLIKYGVGLSTAFLLISFILLSFVPIIIIFSQKRNRNYSHPLWVVSLGLFVTFVGFTLSGSFQEMIKKGEEKSILQNKLYTLIEESVVQRSGLERTLLDFRIALFEENNDTNEESKFYVRKQLSVYNESDIKNSIVSDFELASISHNNKELFTYIHMADMGSVSAIYNDLTFKSNEPEEMLRSYTEIISLYYQVDERISVLNAQYQFLIGEKSSADIKNELKKGRKNNKNLALKLINDLEKLTAETYPKVNLKIDKNRLLE
ncbi:MAG: hypothetical protein ACQEW5_28085 [Bacillota bacterium]